MSINIIFLFKNIEGYSMFRLNAFQLFKFSFINLKMKKKKNTV